MNQLLFITVILCPLKLIGAVTFSWWWTAAPLWVPLALVVAVILIGALCGAAAHFGSIFKNIFKSKNNWKL